MGRPGGIGFAFNRAGRLTQIIYETAKLEELQNAYDHAMKLYLEIRDKR